MDGLQKALAQLRQLGAGRLAALGAIGVFLTAGLLIGSIYLNRPAYTPIYVGLDSTEVTEMGAALSEAGIAYDISADGTSILATPASMTRARMVLAERGLPSSSNSGYELFDNLGSLGLTAFMQEVTRVRALEGEIARSIQAIKGVRSARVHLGLAEERRFRSSQDAAKASVVVRFTGNTENEVAKAIRHLVAAAVPGLQVDGVTVLDATGRVLATGDAGDFGQSSGKLSLQRSIEDNVSDSIGRTLRSYLGDTNFRVSVQALVSTDQQQIEETVFDPESRVERSVQTVRNETTANSQSGAEAVTVEQNIVDEVSAAGGGPASSEQSERLEETTTYELNSKRIATVSNDYEIERLSIAVVVNRARLLDDLGAGASQSEIDAQLATLRQVISASAGLLEQRGDVIELSAVPFTDVDLETGSVSGVTVSLLQHVGTLVNSIAFVVAVWLVLRFGMAPLLAALSRERPQAEAGMAQIGDGGQEAPAALADNSVPQQALPHPASTPEAGMNMAYQQAQPEPLLPPQLPGAAPEDRVAQIVDMDPERAARVLRLWVRYEDAA
ncbi:MAG: flagellar basal-body MS-ring/collar protein FliF [Pseudomonadota bacterium]